MFGITNESVEQYITNLVPARDDAFARFEAEARERQQPIVGPLEGQFLRFVLSIYASGDGGRPRPLSVLELGTNLGYSAVWLGRAVAPGGGRVLTIERDPALATEARKNLAALSLSDVVEVRQGDALSVLATLREPVDVVFNDLLRAIGDSAVMADLLEHSIRLTRPGGLIIADNALHAGEVTAPQAPSARAVARYNELVAGDARLESIIVPIRDGVSLARRV